MIRACHLRCAPFTASSRPCRSAVQLTAQPRRQRRCRGPLCAVAEAGEASAAAAEARTAKEAVETGLERFQEGDAAAALALFLRARELGPNEDESRAALYNAACAYARLARWREASECVISAGECVGSLILSTSCGSQFAAAADRRSGAAAADRRRSPPPPQ